MNTTRNYAPHNVDGARARLQRIMERYCALDTHLRLVACEQERFGSEAMFSAPQELRRVA